MKFIKLFLDDIVIISWQCFIFIFKFLNNKYKLHLFTYIYLLTCTHAFHSYWLICMQKACNNTTLMFSYGDAWKPKHVHWDITIYIILKKWNFTMQLWFLCRHCLYLKKYYKFKIFIVYNNMVRMTAKNIHAQI